MADRTGQRLGNYLLGRKLGAGGFAEVYLGEHLHLGTQAAIKVLNSKISDDEIARFRAEARTIARLKHPHIISVLDFGVDGGDPFLVMQYASGGTLRQHLPKGVQRSPASLLPSVRQIASALQYAHDARIVHRDIKPENMLLNERGDVLLSDFGIAVLTLSSRVQSAQDIAGTAAYMAPEQISAKPHLASDQYAFGIVLYEWLAGERPFEGTTVELFSKHVMTPPPPLSEKVPAISPAVEKVVLIALSKAPQDRFGSMQAFATAFEQACQEPARPLALSGGLPAATVTGQTPQPGDALPSQPTRISEPAPAETAVSATSTPSDGPATELTAAPREEEPRPDVTRRSVLAVAAGVGALAVVGGAAAWLGLVRKSATASPIARATATPTPYPTSTISLTPSATPLPPIKTIPTPLYTFRKHTRGLTILALAWSPQSAGQRVASGSFESLWVWDALTGAHASEFDTGWMTGVAWSPNGKYLAFNATSGGGYKLADATSGAIIASSTSINPSSLSWSPDGQRLAGGNAEPFVLVWDWQNGADSPARWRGHSGFVWNVAWSPNGKYLASASADQTTIIWDAATGTPLKTLKSPDTTSPLLSVSWTNDSNRLAVGDQQGQVIIWDVQAGAQRYKHIAGNGGPYVWGLAWSPDGSRIASSGQYHGQNSVEVWDAALGNTLVRYTGHLGDVNSIAWSPDSKYVASGSLDTTVQVWQP